MFYTKNLLLPQSFKLVKLLLLQLCLIATGASGQVSISPLNIVKILPDPARERLYAIHQNGTDQGALLVYDTSTQSLIQQIDIGDEPSDLSFTEDFEGVLVINSSDPSIQQFDLDTLTLTESWDLSTFNRATNVDNGGHVIDGPGSIIYYIDEQWGPRLHVFDTSNQTVLQTLGSLSADSPNTGNNDGFGDLAFDRVNNRLVGWSQYGTGAGSSSVFLVTLDIAADGLVTGYQRTESLTDGTFGREPYSSPVIIPDTVGTALIKNRLFDSGLLTEIKQYPDNVFASTPRTEMVSTGSTIYNGKTLEQLHEFSAPASPLVEAQAFLPDFSHLVYFAEGQMFWVKLDAATLGAGAPTFPLIPEAGATALPPRELKWPPVEGIRNYEVYLGTDETAVTNAQNNSPQFLGTSRQPQLGLTTLLAPGTYFWKVNPVGGVAGTVQSFTVSDITVSPDQVDIDTLAGVRNLQGSISLASSNGAANWTAAASAPWITITQQSGTTPADIGYTIDTDSLDQAAHTASITITIGSEVIRIPVSIALTEPRFTHAETDWENGDIYVISQARSNSTTPAYLGRMDAATGQLLSAVRCGAHVTDLVVHPKDGRLYVTNAATGDVLAFAHQTLTEEQRYPFGPAEPGDFIREEDFVLSAGAKGRLIVEKVGTTIFHEITLLNTTDGTALDSFGTARKAARVTSPDGRFYYRGQNASSRPVLVKYDLSQDTLNEVSRNDSPSLSSFPSRFMSITADGERIFWTKEVFNSDLDRLFTVTPNRNIISTSFDGRIAITDGKIFDVESRLELGSILPSRFIQAIAPAQDKLYTFQEDEISVFDLTGLIDLPVFEFAPAIESGSTIADLDTQLAWGPSFAASNFQVYFGTDEAAVRTATTTSPSYLGETSSLTWTGAFPPLERGQEYFWRVDRVLAGGVEAGEVWNFSVATFQTNPAAIAINAPIGAPIPNQVVSIMLDDTDSWMASTSTPWLQLTNSTGTGPGNFIVEIDASALNIGTHETTISVSSGGSTFTIPLTVKIDDIQIVNLQQGPTALLALSQTEGAGSPSYLMEISPSTGQITRYLEAGNNASDFAIARDLNRAYFVNPGGHSSPVIDLASWTQIGSLNLDEKFEYLEASADGRLFLEVTGNGRAEVSVFDPATETILATQRFQTPDPAYSAVSANGEFYYHISSGAGLQRYQLQGDSFTRLGAFDIRQNPRDPVQSLFLSPDEDRIFFDTQFFTPELSLQVVFDSPIVGMDSAGEIAIGSDAIYWSFSGVKITDLPFETNFAVVSGDRQHLVRYNTGTKRFISTELSSLVTLPGANPQPGQELTQSPAVLSISPVSGATSYRLFIGEGTNLPNAPTATQDANAGSSFPTPDFVGPFGKYSWRIDAITPGGTVRGTVNTFNVSPRPELSKFEGSDLSSLAIGANEVLMGDGRSRGNALIEFPKEGDLPEMGSVIFNNPNDFGSSAGLRIAKAGGKIFTTDNNQIIQYSQDEFGFWIKEDPISPRTNVGAITGITGSGEILFVKVSVDGQFDSDHVVEIYHTHPTLRHVQTITRPASLRNVAGFASGMEAAEDLLILSNTPGFYEENGEFGFDERLRFYIYRRNAQTGQWGLNETEIVPGAIGSDYKFATDGQRIVLASSRRDTGVRQIHVFARNIANRFTNEWSSTIEDLNLEGHSTFSNPLDVAIDHDLIGIQSGEANVRADHRGATYILKRDGRQWNTQGALSFSKGGVSLQVGIADGFVYSGVRELSGFANSQRDLFLARYDISAGVNRRPTFLALPSSSAATGAPYLSPITVSDDDLENVQVTVEQGPDWLSISQEGSDYQLAGTPPLNSAPIEAVRLKVSDSAGKSSFLVFDLNIVEGDRLPEIVTLPPMTELQVGQTLLLEPLVMGSGDFGWQWFLNGEPIPGETSPTLFIDAVELANGGLYSFAVTNAAGTVQSEDVTVGVSPSSRFAGDWVTHGNSPRHLGHHPATLGTHVFTPAWDISIPETNSVRQPVIVDDRVYLTDSSAITSSNLHARALSLSDGSEIWTHEFGRAGLNPPTYFDQGLYFQISSGQNSQLVALNTIDGTLRWEAPFTQQNGTYKAPAITSDGIFINGGRFSGLYGFNLNGTERFFVDTPQVHNWTPTIHNERLFTWVEQTLSERRIDNGELIWDLRVFSPGNAFRKTGVVAVTENEAVVTTFNEVVCIDTKTREIRWRVEPERPTNRSLTGDASIAHGQAYIFSFPSIEAYDLTTGELTQTYQLPLPVDSPERIVSDQPLLLNDHILYATESATYVFSRESGDLLQTLPVGGELSYANGYLLISNARQIQGRDPGQVHAFFANDIPDFLTESIPQIVEEVAISHQIEVSHDDPTETLTYSMISGPEWLELSESGLLTGTFDHLPGPITELVVEVSDGVTPAVQKVYALDTLEVNDRPVITPITINLEEDAPTFEILLSDFVSDEETPVDELSTSLTWDQPQELLADRVIEDEILKVTVAPDQFGETSITLTITDAENSEASLSIPIIVAPVNDVPVFHTELDNIITNDTADPRSLDLTQFVFDADPDDTLTFSITGNTNPTIFEDLSIGMMDGLLSIQFAPFVSGASEVTLRVTDLEGTFAERTIQVTLPELPLPDIALTDGSGGEIDSQITLNRQTGLYEQKVTFTNTAARAIGGFKVTVGGLSNGYRLYNSEGNAFSYNTSVPAGESVSFVLEYHSQTSREIPTPELSLELTQPEDPLEQDGPTNEIDRMLVLEDQSILLEFPTEPGKRYAIQYSYDMITWITSPTVVTAAANRTQWLDQGLPRTNCHPSECTARFYRVLPLTAGE